MVKVIAQVKRRSDVEPRASPSCRHPAAPSSDRSRGSFSSRTALASRMIDSTTSLLEVRSMPASLCTLRDDGIHASSFHRLRVRHCGHHGDHFGASTMTLGHEVRIWAAHDNAEYRNALIQDDLQRAGD